jgi:hypothetical protein
MRTFGTFLAVGILALAVGCGGSSDSATTTNTVTTTNTTTNPTTNTVTNTVTNTATNTATNTVTASKTSTSTSTGTCNSPSCLANLAATCEPAGTCVEQTDATTGTTAACYSNGVKEIQTVNLTSRAAVVTYKQGSTTCYSVEVGADSTGAIILTFKNASGATIATGTETHRQRRLRRNHHHLHWGIARHAQFRLQRHVGQLNKLYPRSLLCGRQHEHGDAHLHQDDDHHLHVDRRRLCGSHRLLHVTYKLCQRRGGPAVPELLVGSDRRDLRSDTRGVEDLRGLPVARIQPIDDGEAGQPASPFSICARKECL